jgi:putative ABC transport system permease protein
MMSVIRRVLTFFRRDRLDDELAEEIRLHLDLRRRALVEQGLAPADAEREARRQFGNVMAIRERSRDYWGSIALTAFLQDVKFGARVLARSPGLSVVVVLTIAFGAALNGAVFLQLNDAFLREPDLTNADRLVWLDDGGPRTGGATYPDYADYRDRVPAIDLAIFTGGGNKAPAGSANPQPVSIALASGNYFRVLQAPAAFGRTFGPSEDLPPLGTAVAVLSDAYWERQFGRARDVVGRTIDLNFKPFLIIGVMPREFRGVRWPGNRASTPDVWVPIWCHPLLEPGSNLLAGRTMWWGLQPIGRLRDGVAVPQARAQIKAVAAALDVEYPGQRHARAPWVWGVTDFDARILRGQEAAMLGLAGAATMLVMLIACGNVAGLLLARGAARRQEIAIRLSLGASRVRIVRQFLTEGLALSIAGTVLGFIVAGWLMAAAPAAGAASTSIDGRILAYAAFLAVVATLSAGLIPAIQASRSALHPDLTRAQTTRVGRLRMSLVGIEVAISLVLLLTAALLLRGVARASVVDPGMPVEQLLAISMDPSRHGYEGARLEAVVREARRQLEALPGVRSTALVHPAPFSGVRSAAAARRGDMPDSPGVSTFLAEVSPELVDVANLQVVRGRWFDGTGDEEVVINESLATRLWPEGDPLGQRLTTGDFNRRSHFVVGVVRDTPYAELRHQHEPFLFRPGRTGTILVRTSAPAAAVTRVATAAVKQLDARLVVTASLPAERIAQEREAGSRIIPAVGGIGSLALLIALGGVAAIASQSVALRTREIGIRMALGARRSDAVGLIVRLALTPVVIGAIAGLVVASLGSRVLVRQLYGVSPLDPVSFTGTAAFLILAAAAAAWLPARRAATIDPVQALRSE